VNTHNSEKNSQMKYGNAKNIVEQQILDKYQKVNGEKKEPSLFD